MAKKRLVDFRGGINKKISPHMIGDSQGQSAQDTDLSAVRLQGRKKQDTTTHTSGDSTQKANGDFFYSYGNVAGNTDGRWQSTNPADNALVGGQTVIPYIPDATDYEVWNKDLYVARHNDGNGSSNGTILRFLDGASSASQSLNLSPPSAFTLAEDYAYSSSSSSFVSSTQSRGGKGLELKAAVAGQTGIPATSTPVTTTSWNTTYFNYLNAGGGYQMTSAFGVTYTVGGVNYSGNTLEVILTIAPGGNFNGHGVSNAQMHDYLINDSNNTNTGPLNHPGSGTTSNTTYTQVGGAYTGYSVGAKVVELGGTLVLYFSTSFGSTGNIQWGINTGSNNMHLVITGPRSANILTTGGTHSVTFTEKILTSTTTVITNLGQPHIEATPIFVSDDARHFVYRQFTAADGTGPSWTTDSAAGAATPWLQVGGTSFRTHTANDEGYYISGIKGTTGTSTGLPEESQGKTKATPASSTYTGVFGTNAVTTPNQLIFSNIASTTPAAACYRLFRVDSESSVSSPINLGFIAPADMTSGETFSLNSGNIQLSNISNGALYKLNWTCYQNTEAAFTYGSVTQTAIKSTGTVGTNGVAFTGSSTPTLDITLTDTDNSDFRGIDIWLEKRVITGATDTYAIVKCFQYFKNDSTSISDIAVNCHFLDVFASGLSSGSIQTSNVLSAPPDHLKFLKESNNFFFAVGTEHTEPGRYGGSVSYDNQGNATYTANPNIGNKEDSFLFVSTYNNPRDWPIDAYVEFDASITGLASYPGELIVFTENGVYRVTGSRANQMRKAKLATTEGLPANQNKTISLVDNYLVWYSQSGICFYNGTSVTNITKGRFDAFTLGQSVAGQLNGKYYVIQISDETGYVIDFTLEGFPISSVDLSEEQTSHPNPVLVYVPSRNRLYTRHGFVEGNSTRNTFNYKTREFDGGSFGSLKLVKNVTINGSGTGNIQVLLDGQAAFTSAKTVTLASGFGNDQPARVYLPASRPNNPYGLSIADVWSVEITNWNGNIDWIETEYEIIAD